MPLQQSILSLILMGFLFAPKALAILTATSPDSESSSSETVEDTPVVSETMERPPAVGVDKAWRPPNFQNQEHALGYSGPQTFATPAGMEERVQFWKEIYIRYTTDQGVLHDSRYVNLVYETIDFADLVQNSDLSGHSRERGRRDRVKMAKKQIEERLRRLQKLKSAEGLEGDDLRYWKLFEGINEPNKFAEAAARGRLRFQLGQRDRFIEGIYQSGRHLKEMEEIFRRENLPLELTRLPFVESSFNLKARSKVGASGIWQFMRSTARMYMRMDGSVDERNDPIRSTVAATRKMRDNYMMLESWPLAVTGYNHGPSGMLRLVRKFKTNNLAELTDVRKGRFGFASANFYASFLAALQVEQEADRHFGPLNRMAELRGTEIRLTRPLGTADLLRWFDGDLTQAQNLNPHIRPHVWARGAVMARNFIRVPQAMAAQVEEKLKGLKAPTIVAETEGQNAYVIQEGETLSEIADRFKIKLQALLDANGIDNPRRIRAQQKLIIPTRLGANSPPAE